MNWAANYLLKQAMRKWAGPNDPKPIGGTAPQPAPKPSPIRETGQVISPSGAKSVPHYGAGAAGRGDVGAVMQMTPQGGIGSVSPAPTNRPSPVREPGQVISPSGVKSAPQYGAGAAGRRDVGAVMQMTPQGGIGSVSPAPSGVGGSLEVNQLGASPNLRQGAPLGALQ